MNELIAIQNHSDRVTVSARELYKFLEATERFGNWFERMSKYGFEDGVDYVGCEVFNTLAKQNLQDYQLTVDCAKQISMLQRNDKGTQARKYFIEVEKAWNTPEKIMARALELADKEIKNLTTTVNTQKQVIGELKPKADYLDKILQSKSLVTIGQIAKDYGMSAFAMNRKLHELKVQYKQGGQWLLYSKYHALGYTHSETFDVEDAQGNPKTFMNTKWTQKGRLFLYELLKNNDVIPVIEQ